MKWCVLVLVFASLSRGDNVIDADTIDCMRLNAQEEIDLDKVCDEVVVVVRLTSRNPPSSNALALVLLPSLSPSPPPSSSPSFFYLLPVFPLNNLCDGKFHLTRPIKTAQSLFS